MKGQKNRAEKIHGKIINFRNMKKPGGKMVVKKPGGILTPTKRRAA